MVITVIGGSGSGKSEFAENLAFNISQNTLYLATMENITDASKNRILRHKELRRDKNFKLAEKQTALYELDYKEFDCVLVECISNLVANEIFTKSETNPLEEIIKGIKSINSKNIVFVTNNIFSDIKNFENYSEIHGLANIEICSFSDEVYEVVAGIPIKIKG